jgi:dipeptidase E
LPPEPTILALGGHWMEPHDPLDDLVVELTGTERPRVLLLPTASGDSDSYIVRFYATYGPRAQASHLKLFGIPPPELRELVLAQDAVFVAGGNTANMLAVWRVHGLDAILREAWKGGVVLAGSSAGSICWFEAGVTDSFRAELDGIDCLGFLSGSNCPHYDGEEYRRPAYRRLLEEGFPPGLAADDLVGLLFRGTDFVEAVTSRTDGAAAYRVSREGEERIEPRRLRLSR